MGSGVQGGHLGERWLRWRYSYGGVGEGAGVGGGLHHPR